MVPFIRITALLLLFICLPPMAWSQDKPSGFPKSAEGMPPSTGGTVEDDPWGRGTPRGTVAGFMRAANRQDYLRAGEYLETRKTGEKREEIARQLEAILEHSRSTNIESLSRNPEGNLRDGLPINQENVGLIKTQTDSLEIILKRVQQGNNPPIWLFSAETLREIPEFYEGLEITWVEAYMPKVLVETRFLSLPLLGWIVILLAIPLSWGLASLFLRAMGSVSGLLIRRLGLEQDKHLIAILAIPLRLLILALILRGIPILGWSLISRRFLNSLGTVLAVVGLTWFLARLVDISAELKSRQFQRTGRSGTATVLRLLSRLAKAAIAIVGVLILFYMAGMNLTALLAGLGVGGLAVAFAAQKTLENLFGGIMVISDRPIRVGDVCRAGDYTGTVEDIGLRSTRIRTQDRTVVSVPNGQVAALSLENFTLRDKFWFHHNLRLRGQTAADQLRYVLAEVRRLLYEHPKAETQSSRVRLIGFKEGTLEIEVFAYIIASSYDIFLAIQEDLLLRIMDLIEGSGTGVANSAQTMYVARDGGLDAEKSREAVARVRNWRDHGELPFPNFSPGEISRMKDRLPYPPPGSAQENPEK